MSACRGLERRDSSGRRKGTSSTRPEIVRRRHETSAPCSVESSRSPPPVITGGRLALWMYRGNAQEQGQFSVKVPLTATRRQRSASEAFGGSVPETAQMHSGRHCTEPTAARRMNRQSDASGLAPEDSG